MKKFILWLSTKLADSTCKKIERRIEFYDADISYLQEAKNLAIKRLQAAENDAHSAHRQLLMLRGE